MSINRTVIPLMGIMTTVFMATFPCRAVAEDIPPAIKSEVVRELMVRDLLGAPGKTLDLLTVEYVPGGASLPHRHNAQVFVYVLQGQMRMQVKGSPLVTLGPGETFYEGPDDIHTVSANASQTKPAQILVFIVKDKNRPASKGDSDGDHR